MERLEAENGARAASTQRARGWGGRRGEEVDGAVGSGWAWGRQGSRRHGFRSRMSPGAGWGGPQASRTEGHQHSTWGGMAAARGHAARRAPGGEKWGWRGCGGKWPSSPSTQPCISVISQKINQTKPKQPPINEQICLFMLIYLFIYSFLFIAPTFWLQIFHCTMNLPAVGQSISVVIYLFFSPFWDRKPN